MQWVFEVSHSLWVNWIYALSIIHKTNELFSYRYLFLCDRIRFLPQLHEDSCQSLFFLWFCPPNPKFVLTLIKEWGNNIAPCQYIKEWESSTSSLANFFNNFVDVVEPVRDCTAQTGEHYTVKLFRKSATCNQWYYNIRINSSYNALFHTTFHKLDHVVNLLLISFFCSINIGENGFTFLLHWMIGHLPDKIEIYQHSINSVVLYCHCSIRRNH